MRSIENELDEIYEEKNREKIEAYKTRIKFMEQWEMDLSRAYYKLLMRYYDILSFEICWKFGTVDICCRYKDIDKKAIEAFGNLYPRYRGYINIF